MVSPTASRNKTRLGKINILVVDDDRAISNLLRDVLKNLGFGNVILAHNAEDGLRMLEDNPVDIIITDWEMEPMNGVEFTRTVRQLNTPKRFLPIIMLTGHGEKSEIELARDCGITEYLIKPFTAKTLCSRITTVVDSPRSFIMSRSYKGPNRRRRNEDPPDGIEKRINLARKKDAESL